MSDFEDLDAGVRTAKTVTRAQILADRAYLARFWAEVYRGTRTDAIISWIKEYMRQENGAICSSTAAIGIYQFTHEYTPNWAQIRPMISMILCEKMPRIAPEEWYLEVPPAQSSLTVNP